MRRTTAGATAHPEPTRRLYFRTWRPQDLPLALLLFGDARVTSYIGGPFTEAQIRERFEREIDNLAKFQVQYWPVFVKVSDDFAGVAKVSDDFAGVAKVSDDFAGCCGLRPRDPAQGSFEIGFYLRPKYWGKGLAAEAAQAVATYAFDAVGARRLFAGHHPENAASRRALAKLGMRYTHDELYPPTGLLHPSYILERNEPRPEVETDD